MGDGRAPGAVVSPVVVYTTLKQFGDDKKVVQIMANGFQVSHSGRPMNFLMNVVSFITFSAEIVAN